MYVRVSGFGGGKCYHYRYWNKGRFTGDTHRNLVQYWPQLTKRVWSFRVIWLMNPDRPRTEWEKKHPAHNQGATP